MNRDGAIGLLEVNLWSLWANFGRSSDGTLHEDDDVLWFETPLRHAPYNTVMRFRVADEMADTRIDDILDVCRRRDVPVVWLLHPTARPSDLGDRLTARGLPPLENITGMLADLSVVPPPDGPGAGIHISEVTGDAEAEEVVGLVAWRYGLPDGIAPTLRSMYEILGVGRPGAATRIWLAREAGRPVSKAILHVGGGVAGIHGVATRPEARGLGLARTLTLVALAAARRDGHERAVLHSTPVARSLYASIGFEPVADFVIHAAAGDLDV